MLTPRQYAGFTVGFLILVIYGSLVPFHFQPLCLGEAVERFRAVCSEPVSFESRSDWTANILLFIPLSYLCMAAMSVDQGRFVGVFAGLLVLPCCVVLSAAIEFTQLFFPPRVSSLNDVVAESLGGLLGVMLWLLRGQRITDWARRALSGFDKEGLAARLWPGYLVFLVAIHTMPFDLTISPVELYHKYHEGRVQLVPFLTPYGDFYAAADKNLQNLGYFFPAGLLLAGFPNPLWRQHRSWLRVLSLGAGLSGLVELLQLFVYSRYCDATDVVTGTGAVLLGWASGLAYQRAASLSPWQASSKDGTHAGSCNLWRSPLWLSLLLGWLGLLVFINWQPFDFTADRDFLTRRLSRISLLPFADYQKADYLSSFEQIVDKIVLFLPIGTLLAPTGRWFSKGFAQAQVVLVAIMLAAGLEAGQLFLPTRYPSITDVLIESFGAWLGFVLASHAWDSLRNNTSALPAWRHFCPSPQRHAGRSSRTGF